VAEVEPVDVEDSPELEGVEEAEEDGLTVSGVEDEVSVITGVVLGVELEAGSIIEGVTTGVGVETILGSGLINGVGVATGVTIVEVAIFAQEPCTLFQSPFFIVTHQTEPFI
jgi:hypothetical protein